MAGTVLITGGTKGIGLETTAKFLDLGYRVIVIARSFKDFIYKDNKNIEVIEFDVSNISEIPVLVNRAGDIDILINNAGFNSRSAYSEYEEADADKTIDVNIKAPVAFIREVSRQFLRKGKGRIVNVASQAAQVGHSDIWYGITKAGLVNVTKSFANLLGDKGVVINAVAPGPVDTPFVKDVANGKRFAEIKRRVYLNRIAAAEEVARAIVWLATESPEYINGETININNGAQFIKG